MEYFKELYAFSLDDRFIWAKCPFVKTNHTHRFKNKTGSLLNSEEEREVNDWTDGCQCGDRIVLNVGNYTNRISLSTNKRKTNYIQNNKSRKRLQLLWDLEKEGRRALKEKKIYDDEDKFNPFNCSR